jgi:hypothetical protein
MDDTRRLCDLAEALGQRSRELTLMARAGWDLERLMLYSPTKLTGLVDRHDGSTAFTEADLTQLQSAFQARFDKPLPVSAHGESAVHRALGFDHRGRVDVAVSPEQAEGRWVRSYLVGKNIPFFAFRSAVPGVATGAHIHIGPASTRRGHSD